MDIQNPVKQYYSDYAQNMNYVNRWVIQKQDLPESVKKRVLVFFENNPEIKRLFLPLVEAIENNNPAIIMENV